MKKDGNTNIRRPHGFAQSNQTWTALAFAAGLLLAGCAPPIKPPSPMGKTEQSAITIAQALAKLEAGNSRFVAGKPLSRHWPQQRAQTGVAVTDSKFIATVAELNVHQVMRQIRPQSPVLEELIDSGKVGLVGGIYDRNSGQVHLFKQ